MPGLREYIIVFFIVGELFNHYSSSNGRPAAEVANVIEASSAVTPFPIQKPLTKFAVGTLTSILLTKLLYLDKGDNAQCALSIHNKLTSYRLVNPYLFIMHGGNPMPVPLKIKANSSEETTLEAVSRTGATSGLLFYEIEHVGQYLMIFWKIQGSQVAKMYVPNRFFVDITATLLDDKSWLEATYNIIKKQSDKMQGPNEHFEIIKDILKSPGRPNVPAFKITVQAQMTMGKKAEFMVELKDNLPPPAQPQYYKRDVIGTSLALAFIRIGLNLAFKKITSYIPSEQSCTIALENLCKDETLIKPSWYITAGETSNIVPWEIKSDEIGEISFVIPLGGARITESFKHTVYFLSYHIDGTEYDMVIGTWFPLKMETKDDWEDIMRRETARYTIFILKPPTAIPMKNVLKIIGDLFVVYKNNPEQLHKNLISTNKAVYDSIVHTSLTNLKIPLVQTTKFQKYLEWQYPLFSKPLAAGKDSNDKYYIKIVSGMGIGRETGMVVKVEIVNGTSPISFNENNPQGYREPPDTEGEELGTQDVGAESPSQTTNAGLPPFPTNTNNAGLPPFPTKTKNAGLSAFPTDINHL